MNLTQIRRLVITAMFSDNVLFERLVLKGGNALELLHRIGGRGSIDLDFSLEEDFADVPEIRDRIFHALHDRFDSAGSTVFDETFQSIPPDSSSKWGGYRVFFKVIDQQHAARIRQKHKDSKRSLEQLRREAEVVGPLQQRTFKIDISKYEFCSPKVEMQLDDYTVYVYSPAMIAIEKLRAICQQMPQYNARGHRTPRARDFYDIHAILTTCEIDISTEENLELVRNIFAAKDVPLNLLSQIQHQGDFHRADWPAVENAVAGTVLGFDYYFEFVVNEVSRLQSLWVVDAPR